MLKAAATIFAFVAFTFFALPHVTTAQETCSQAAARCVNNCNTGHAATEALKARCTSDCAARRTDCLSTGNWRQSNKGYSDRSGLIKK